MTLGPAGTTAEPIVSAGEVRAPAPGGEASGATDEPRRFDPPLLFDVLPDGSVAYCDSAGYSIKLVAGDGAPIGAIARPLTPEPVTTEIETTVRDSAMAEFERLYGDPANPQGPDRAPREFMAEMVAQMRADIEGMQFNHEVPVVLSPQGHMGGRALGVPPGRRRPLGRSGRRDRRLESRRTLRRHPAAGRSPHARRVLARWAGRLGRAGRTGRAEDCGGEVAMPGELIMR